MSLSDRLLQIGRARTGIAPVNLLDVMTAAGDSYFWADRSITAQSVLGTAAEGDGVSLIVPAAAAIAQLDWEDQAGGGDQSFGNGSVQISFDGQGGATIVYLGHPHTTTYLDDFGASGQRLVGQQLGVTGPVAIPNLPSPGSELVVEIWTSVGGHFYSGPASRNSDNFIHAHLSWTKAPIFPAAIERYEPWLLSVSGFKFHRSLQTDTGSFVIQNVSGDTLSTDFEKIARRSTLEGALFVYRMWEAAAEAAWLEVHGTLTVEDIDEREGIVRLKASQLTDCSQSDTPLETYSESCQLDWGSRRCGATGSVECKYSFPTCQVPARFMGVLNSYEKNYGEATATVATKTINRRRKL